nr:IS630 family transposase [uncultured bacterium]
MADVFQSMMSSWWGEQESSSGEAAVEDVVAVLEPASAPPGGGNQVLRADERAVGRGGAPQYRSDALDRVEVRCVGGESRTSTIGPPSCWCAVWMRSR